MAAARKPSKRVKPQVECHTVEETVVVSITLFLDVKHILHLPFFLQLPFCGYLRNLLCFAQSRPVDC